MAPQDEAERVQAARHVRRAEGLDQALPGQIITCTGIREGMRRRAAAEQPVQHQLVVGRVWERQAAGPDDPGGGSQCGDGRTCRENLARLHHLELEPPVPLRCSHHSPHFLDLLMSAYPGDRGQTNGSAEPLGPSSPSDPAAPKLINETGWRGTARAAVRTPSRETGCVLFPPLPSELVVTVPLSTGSPVDDIDSVQFIVDLRQHRGERLLQGDCLLAKPVGGRRLMGWPCGCCPVRPPYEEKRKPREPPWHFSRPAEELRWPPAAGGREPRSEWLPRGVWPARFPRQIA